MKKFLKYINANVLHKAANLNIATIITKIIAGILTSKAIAIYIGAEGMALIGNLRNFLGATQSFAILGVYKGVVKYIGEFKNNTVQLSKTISTAYYLGFFITLISAFFCYYNADLINDFLFTTNYNYAYVIRVLALALPFYSLNVFCFSIMNGFSNYRMLLVINIIGQILGLSVTLLLIYIDNIDGALISAVITPSLIFLITLVAILNRKNLITQIKISNIDFDVLKKFSPYILMALVSSIAIPIVLIIIRNYIIDNVGLKEAGYWEAMNRVSDYYLMFINSLMALYILPRFSEIDTKKAFRDEIFNFYKTVIPVFGIGLVAIYFLRVYIITGIFSEEFKPVEDLFLWQLLGDFVKVLSTVIAYQFLAKKMFWHFIILEVFLFVTMYISSVSLIDNFGVKGAVIGHFVTYFIHYGIVLLIFGSSLFGVVSEEKE